MSENKNQLREDAINFALEISDVFDTLSGYSIYKNQLLRCSSSIGANIYEAKYAQSRADFINKLEVALKESSESEYWLELFFRKKLLDEKNYKRLKSDCGSIRSRLIKSIITAKNNVDM